MLFRSITNVEEPKKPCKRLGCANGTLIHGDYKGKACPDCHGTGTIREWVEEQEQTNISIPTGSPKEPINFSGIIDGITTVPLKSPVSIDDYRCQGKWQRVQVEPMPVKRALAQLAPAATSPDTDNHQCLLGF